MNNFLTKQDKNPDIKLILDVKEEYINQFINVTKDRFKEGYQSIYDNVKDNNKVSKLILKEFQEKLKLVPLWSEKIIEDEFNRIKIVSKCDYLGELIESLFLCYSQMFQIVNNKNYNLPVKIPSHHYVLHNCYIEIARELWKRPQLLYHKYDTKKIQEINLELDNLLKDSINKSIKNLIPFKHLLNKIKNIQNIEDKENNDKKENEEQDNNDIKDDYQFVNVNENDEIIEEFELKDYKNKVINNKLVENLEEVEEEQEEVEEDQEEQEEVEEDQEEQEEVEEEQEEVEEEQEDQEEDQEEQEEVEEDLEVEEEQKEVEEDLEVEEEQKEEQEEDQEKINDYYNNNTVLKNNDYHDIKQLNISNNKKKKNNEKKIERYLGINVDTKDFKKNKENIKRMLLHKSIANIN